jgi:GAF domain-containing protein
MTGTRRDLVADLAATASDVAPALGLPDAEEMLRAVCTTACGVFRAAACSVAQLVEDKGVLRYRAAVGAGAEGLVGLELSLDRGLASYVATSGQAIAVDQVRQDPRFAKEIAEATGYVPQAMLVVPIEARTGEVLGVLAVLDADRDAVPAEATLELAAAFADQAALALALGSAVTNLGAVLLRSMADAVAAEDKQLASALRRRAGSTKGADAQTAALAARFGELHRLGPGVTATAGYIVDELIDYARASRGRSR